jgi:hypothetical protein
MHEPVALEVGVPAATIDMLRHGKPVADVPEKEAALIHLAREAVGAKQVTPATYATALALFGEEELLHYSVLIASYAQGAILLASWGRNCTITSRRDCRSRKSNEVLRRKHRCQKPFLQTIGLFLSRGYSDACFHSPGSKRISRWTMELSRCVLQNNAYLDSSVKP